MEDHVFMRRSGFLKEEKPDSTDDNDLSSGSGGGDGDEALTHREEGVAKVGSKKRAYHDDTEDLKSSSLLELNNREYSSWTKKVVLAAKNERSNMDSDSKVSSSSHKDQDWLESARAEMGEVRQENQRLKMCLGQMMKDYQALQLQFHDIMQREESKKKSTSTVDNAHPTSEELELFSLSLGRFSSEHNEKSKTFSEVKDEDDEMPNKGLSLGLDCKFEVSKSHGNRQSLSINPSPVDSSEEQPKEEAGETWPPKVVKSTTMPSGEDEAVQQNSLRKTRVCVRARCDTPTMNDGCQWRKYGQKIAKGNPCPRAYYRCTVAPSCPVRKQVQRCSDDMSILLTTYEGTHNHPLPLSATAMASATSAAASMLLSGSSSSTSRANTNNPSSSTSIPADLHGLNFYISNDKQFYLHNSSLSPSPSHPTITLDLTSSNLSSSSPFINKSSSFLSTYTAIPKFSSASPLSFSSSESSTLPWGNGFVSYGNTTNTSRPYDKSPLGNLNLGRSTMENNIFQSFMQKKTPPITTTHHQQPPLPADTIAAATKAITADPSFQSALAAALTSIIGTGSGSSSSGGGGGGGGANFCSADNVAQTLKWGEHFPVALASTASSTASKSNACATSYFNRSTSTPATASSQPGNMIFLAPNSNSLPFSSPKNSSASSNDNRDHS